MNVFRYDVALAVLAKLAMTGGVLLVGPAAARAAGSDPVDAVTAQGASSFEGLSPPREIARAWSAARDTPALELGILPRPVNKAGGELALATLRWPSWAVRADFAGFVELEVDGKTDRFHSGPLPGASTGPILWRGSYAFELALAPTALARRLCAGCALEATLGYRHESQHYTGSNAGDEGQDFSAQPYVGDDVVLDVAMSQRTGAWFFAERAIGMGFLPGRSSYAAGGGADLHARWTHWPRLHPFVSAYGEALLGHDLRGRRFPDAHRLRGLAGLAVPSPLGETMIFVSGELGNRYGLRILTEEAILGVGVRLAIGSGTGGH